MESDTNDTYTHRDRDRWTETKIDRQRDSMFYIDIKLKTRQVCSSTSKVTFETYQIKMLLTKIV